MQAKFKAKLKAVKIYKAKILGFCLVLICLTMLLGAITWDSSQDPLVSKSWVDNYVNQKAKLVEAKIEQVAKNIKGGSSNSGSTVIEMQINQGFLLVNGVKTTLDTPPIIYNGRTMLPLRPLGENLKAELVWDNTNKKVIYKKAGVTLELIVNQKEMKVGGISQALDVAPILKNNRVLVPVRVVSNGLGAKVNWDNNTKKVTITY